MQRWIVRLCICIVCMMLAPAAGASPTDLPGTSQYQLGPSSEFETGCFGPCLCPVFLRLLQGTFTLQEDGVDPLFTHYKVTDVRWTVPGATSAATITGSGTYKVGGEVAVQHEMTLDLSVDGGTPQHFDSGLVLGGGDFPRIVIDISLHQETACVDTVMHVDATDPVVAGAGQGEDPPASVRFDAAPNPFHEQTTFHLYLSRPGSLDLVIYDVRGRAVRHLVKTARASAGSHTFSWDGQRDEGGPCASGVYFVGSRGAGGWTMARIVKLD
jgi:hypothetical protein